MINVIYGPKGSGKTKKIVDNANAALDVCKGNIAFITDVVTCSREVKTAIRFIDLNEYGKFNEAKIEGFVDGLIASNTDLNKIYIDGLVRILGIPVTDLEELFVKLETVSEIHKVDFCISVTCDKIPKYMKKYI